MSRIAGHEFSNPDGRCSCGKRFADIAWATKANVGEPDIAHVGALNAAELGEIEAERNRVWQAVCEGVGL